ncbi:S-layer homology domain-containing protein [Lysinibacillus xylanilyticus]|uniref:S-layer homology domain-containing protein n=1 Tax=Lysinibacillus xylanilyticus TaxID=582475 RepID=UPI0036D92D67
MKKQIKVAAMSTFLLSSLAVPTVSFATEPVAFNVQESAKFTDVDKNHYAYDAIQWAQQQGIVRGYPDDTFRPNEELTESEFVNMLAKFLKIKDDKGEIIYTKYHWADRYYDGLASYGVPLNGYFDTTIRDKAVKRGVVAQAISHLTGNANSLIDSINFMINEGITTGQNPQFEGKDLFTFFGSNSNLTRSQATAFLYRMHKLNIEQASGIALDVHKNSEGLSLIDLANDGISKLDNSLRFGKLGSETTPDFSGAMLPVSDSANARDVDVNVLNKVASLLSNNTINKIKENGYEVLSTRTTGQGDITTIHFSITISTEIEKIMKYRFLYSEDLDIELVKSIVKDLSGVTLTDADLSQTTKVTKGKVVIKPWGVGMTDIIILH